MSDQLKPLPVGTELFPSVQVYKNFCSIQEKKILKPDQDPVFNLEKTRVLDINPKDKKLELNYTDPKNNFFCGAYWNLDNHEMVARAGSLEPLFIHEEGVLPMRDACSLHTHLIPEAPVCQDEFVSPELNREGVQESSSFKNFMAHCQEKLQQQAQDLYGTPPVLGISPKQIQAINPDQYDPFWFFRYESLGQGFFCEGVADFKAHRMHLKAGALDQQDRIPFKENFHMTDACSLTEAIFGNEKYLGKNCVDKSASEIKREYYTEVGFNLLVSGLAIFTTYKLSKGFLSQAWKAASPYAIPLAKQAFTKTLPLWNAIYSFEGAAVRYFTSPLSKVGWAGRLGWAGVSFYAGYKAGGLVDQIPKIFGGKNISDYGADGLESLFGKPPGWMVDATDWVSNLF